MKLSNILLMSYGLLLLIGVSSCKKEGCTDATANNYNSEAKKDDGSCTYTDEVDPYLTEKQAVKETYANIAFAVYEDAYDGAVILQTAIDLFVATPTQINFDAAKQAWLDARESYGQTEIFRFVDGPIDNSADGPEGLVNAWPMDEAFVDYVVGSPNAGIINNLATYPTINVSTLVGANEFGGEENVSVGYHAIEFLLWGQDLSSSTAGADLLVQALNQVKSEWDPIGANNYRTTWLNMDNKTALRKMFNSIRVMSGEELSGERIYTAYDNQDQEDEHSCFSDNTHRDIALNSQGIENLYLGTYTRTDNSVVSGFSLSELVVIVNSGKNTEMIAQLTDAKTKISLMMIPFDQAIILPAERPKVLDAVNSLVAEETIILAIAASFDITF